MGLLAKLFGRKAAAEALGPQTTEPVCLHTSAAPQWDSPADMGQEERATRFVCATCGATFTPAEFAALRASEAERLRHLVGPTPDGDNSAG